MMKKIYWGALLLPALVFSACSFSTESAVRDVLGTSSEVPVFLGCRTVSEREINFQFSLPVKVAALNFDPPVEVESIGEGTVVIVGFKQPLGLGERVVADILVEDEEKNTLNVLIPFRARNNRMPRLLINELRTEYSKPKVEFVELRAESAGNLGALRLFIASNGLDEPILEFPPAEVREGEYIVVHLRTVEPGWVNETGEDLGESKGTEALNTARDFWVPESAKRLRKTDAVFLADQDDRIIDAVLLSENPDPWWGKEAFADTAGVFSMERAWISSEGRTIPGPPDAIISKNTTTTRTICRNEGVSDSNRAGDWYITVTSGATAGGPNNPNLYTPKN